MDTAAFDGRKIVCIDFALQFIRIEFLNIQSAANFSITRHFQGTAVNLIGHIEAASRYVSCKAAAASRYGSGSSIEARASNSTSIDVTALRVETRASDSTTTDSTTLSVETGTGHHTIRMNRTGSSNIFSTNITGSRYIFGTDIASSCDIFSCNIIGIDIAVIHLHTVDRRRTTTYTDSGIFDCIDGISIGLITSDNSNFIVSHRTCISRSSTSRKNIAASRQEQQRSDSRQCRPSGNHTRIRRFRIAMN